MRTIAEYVAARRAKWRSDTESTIRFESTLYRNALLKGEKREISRRERLPVELIRIDQLDEMELVELLISRIKAEIAGLSRVAERLKAAGVKLRRTKQIKVDLAVLREERGWLASEREAIRARGYEKNAKFAELRAKFEAGEMAGELSPVEPRKEKPRKVR